MNGTDNEVQIGSGKSPEGVAVKYFEVRGSDDKRITHSDSLEGLKKAGYTVNEVVDTPNLVTPETQLKEVLDEAASKDEPEKSIEDELAA